MEPLTKVHHQQLTWSSSDVTQRCCRLGLPVLCYSWFPVSPRAALSVSRGVEMAVLDHWAGCFPYNVRRSYKKATWKPNWFGQRQGKCPSHRTIKKRSKGRHREADSPPQIWPSVADLHWTHPLRFPKGCARAGAGAKHSEDAIRSTARASQSSSLPLPGRGRKMGTVTRTGCMSSPLYLRMLSAVLQMVSPACVFKEVPLKGQEWEKESNPRYWPCSLFISPALRCHIRVVFTHNAQPEEMLLQRGEAALPGRRLSGSKPTVVTHQRAPQPSHKTDISKGIEVYFAPAHTEELTRQQGLAKTC